MKLMRKSNAKLNPFARFQGVSILGMLLAIPVLLLIVFLLTLGFYEARKAYWDYQVREMCAKDGGIKIYETVNLPPEKFNEWGQVNFYRPTQKEQALGSEYQFKENITALKTGDLELLRYHYEVIRRADLKLLSQTVSYQRGGGDLPGPWQSSAFTCPAINVAGPNALLMNTFLREQK